MIRLIVFRLAKVIPALLLMTLILALVSQVAEKRPSELSSGAASYASHVGMYAVVAALILFAVTHRRSITLSRVFVAMVVSVMFGIADEINQSTIAGRSANELDVLADAAGATITCLVIWNFSRWRQRREVQTRS